MEHTAGRPELLIGLIDGPADLHHPELEQITARGISGVASQCSDPRSEACAHGTMVAGVLAAPRGTAAPALCPDCTYVLRPVFTEAAHSEDAGVSASALELEQALVDVMAAGVRIINLSVAVLRAEGRERALTALLDEAARRGIMVVAAAGNQGQVGSSVLTRHPWVIPVVACGHDMRPLAYSNLSGTIGRHGLLAPGDRVVTLRAGGGTTSASGTSIAAPFVTGALALLWSVLPRATATELRGAVAPHRRSALVPPLLDAWAAYQGLAGGDGIEATAAIPHCEAAPAY